MLSDKTYENTWRLFSFLKGYASIRFPLVRELGRVRWKLELNKLPHHSSITVNRFVTSEQENDGTGVSAVLIRIRRPRRSLPPKLPVSLEGWIDGPYDDPYTEPKFFSKRNTQHPDGTVRIERFDEDAERLNAWSVWLEKWRIWASNERPIREAEKTYERFHELYGELLREGERYELVLADGIIFWRWNNGFIHYPVILLPVQLQFDSNGPEFIVLDTDQNPELNTIILHDAPVTNHEVLSILREEVVSGKTRIHPLEDGGETTAFLRRLARSLSADGEYIDKPIDPLVDCCTHPLRIWRQPMLILRERSQGYVRAIERVLDVIRQNGEIPEAICSIIGVTSPSWSVDSSTPYEAGLSNDDIEILRSVYFPKPWNHEQLCIAERLKRFRAVLVQGPPGTGKTHTIANLVGHLLAEGKSVLITAHTSKALRVLREHIPERLRPLVISVLDDELHSRRQLEEAAQAITEHLSRDVRQFHEEANRYECERNRILDEIMRLRTQLIEAIGSEYRSIVIAGREYSPSEAGRLVAEGIGRDDWIPPPVKPGAPLPLSQEELAELYRLNKEISEEEERELATSFPDIKKLFSPDEFENLVSQIKQPVDRHHSEWWVRNPTYNEIPDLENVAKKARTIGELIQKAEPWELRLIGSHDSSTFEKELFNPAEALVQQLKETISLRIQYEPLLPDDGIWEEYEQIAQELAELAQRRGGQLRWYDKLILFFKPRHKRFLAFARVVTGKPLRVEHFRALAVEARIRKERKRLYRSWNHLIAHRGGPEAKTLGEHPEETILRWRSRLLRWHSLYSEISALKSELQRLGLCWECAFQEPTSGDITEQWRALGEFLLKELSPALEAAAILVRQQECKRRIQEASHWLKAFIGSNIVTEILQALEELDINLYRKAYKHLSALWAKHIHLVRRIELLERLSSAAPGWANAIRTRSGIHGNDELPGNPFSAWLWRQLHDELVRRSEIDVQELQCRLEEYMQRLRQVTEGLIYYRAWAHRVEKTSLEHRQALIGWLNTIRRIGKGTGRSAARLREEAAKLLAKAREAVPVWIMPLWRVAEQIDPIQTRFDVLIVDEASQCDILGLIAIFPAKQVIIVGDHEQVSPEGVGQDLDRLQHLQREFLQGYIPNAHLYDGRRSLYDIARESFGGGVMLTEHFRCVPEIIAFSNRLCYQGRIRPLRESNSTLLKPAVIPYKVNGTAHAKVNEEEAKMIAAIILAILRHPVYAEKTIGVISMVGDEQAKHIERLVRTLCRNDPELDRELDKRKFLCGNPAQFQGDERDVILLSLVDSPRLDGPLPMRNDERFKQRFNVAVSRARDQLWVIYSLDPANDLKEGDLRRELIEFAKLANKNPDAVIGIPEVDRTESPFEREVLKWLVNKGYRVRAQHTVGTYRIDLVVEGEANRRIAIECDGDRYHTIERIPEDLERQAVLERLGWRFIRIRGSEFYRDREGTMRRVEQELDRLGIHPRGRFSVGNNDDIISQQPLVEEILREAEKIKTIYFQS
jgi:very-short-patch-repair endonuclease